ncbi:hypothetical protein LZ31DRAFT_554295 [Colletotrichum somersetense]|nr:hypothetical protein LZ31DRAFT_554295 [Colletotrichum somersetense]
MRQLLAVSSASNRLRSTFATGKPALFVQLYSARQAATVASAPAVVIMPHQLDRGLDRGLCSGVHGSPGREWPDEDSHSHNNQPSNKPANHAF